MRLFALTKIQTYNYQDISTTNSDNLTFCNMEWASEKRSGLDIDSSNLIFVNITDSMFVQKGRDIIFKIPQYRIIISSELRYLQDITTSSRHVFFEIQSLKSKILFFI